MSEALSHSQRLARFLHALAIYLRTSIATMIQYRAAVALWAIWGIVYPSVALVMWSAAARSSGQSSLSGYDERDFAAYFLLSMIVSHLNAAWDVFEMGWMVRSGSFSPKLLRPMLPIWTNITDNLAYKLVTLAILIPLWLLIAWWFQPRFSTTLAHVAGGAVATVLAAAINFIWGYTLGLVAFWTTRTDGVAGVWFGGSLVFGGRFAPLALLPGLLAWVPDFLPFKWMNWFPVVVLTGKLAAGQILPGLLWQAGWLAAGILIFRLAWGRALRRYTAVGA